MQVRAKGDHVVVGYYNHLRRRGGDVFNLEDPSHFSARWMERVDGDEDATAPVYAAAPGRSPVAMGDVAKYNDDPAAARRAREALQGAESVTGKRKN